MRALLTHTCAEVASIDIMTSPVLVPAPAVRSILPKALAVESCEAAAKVLLAPVLAPVANNSAPPFPAAVTPVVTSMMPVLAEFEIVVRVTVPCAAACGGILRNVCQLCLVSGLEKLEVRLFTQISGLDAMCVL